MASGIEIQLPDEAATLTLAGRLARLAERGDVLALSGGLGAGKTVLARGFIRARFGEAEEVPSPTFTLVQTYGDPGGGIPVFHFDLFRLSVAEEAYELGFEEALATGIALIEWPERLGALLPADRLDVTLVSTGLPAGGRLAILAGAKSWHRRLREAGLAA